MLKKLFIFAIFILLATAAGCSRADEEECTREQEEINLLRAEAGFAVQNERFASAIRLLDYLGDFPEAEGLRRDAEYGMHRASVIRRVGEALDSHNYAYALEILNANPDFDDDMGFRNRALTAIIMETTETETADITLEALQGSVAEMFQVTSLVIESRNQTMTTVVPGGFANPGEITLIMEFDSTVEFGVANPQRIVMHVVDGVVHITRSSIHIEVLHSSVRNFEQIKAIRSNPLVSFTAAVNQQIFDAQAAMEEEMARRFVNEMTIDSARRSFMNSLEAFIRGMGLAVHWV
ncbi:MAG: hypothetical protein FWB88_04790 [Defluviitaleaceae bacterium]|nr:hypothetical protein [Defluviitaleaceae bacterium]MCL2238654.1 hypothetical protein [Defluviitaleaceae bacterium]